jgi:hypothetical protein
MLACIGGLLLGCRTPNGGSVYRPATRQPAPLPGGEARDVVPPGASWRDEPARTNSVGPGPTIQGRTLDAWSYYLLGDVYEFDSASDDMVASAEESARAEEVFLQAEANSLAWLDRMVLQGNREQLGRGVRSLARMAGKSDHALERLIRATHSDESLARETAAYWARTIETGSEGLLRVRTRLREMLLDRDANVRAHAAGSLRALESRG